VKNMRTTYLESDAWKPRALARPTQSLTRRADESGQDVFDGSRKEEGLRGPKRAAIVPGTAGTNLRGAFECEMTRDTPRAVNAGLTPRGDNERRERSSACLGPGFPWQATK
jgi:hypothetical protein